MKIKNEQITTVEADITVIEIDFQWLGWYSPSVQTLFVAAWCHFESCADSSSSSAPDLWRFSAAPAGVGAIREDIKGG